MPMPQWETDEEFDDGGTPAWRARDMPDQRTIRQPLTIDAPPRSLREAWGRLSIQQVFLIGYFLPLLLMAALVIGTFGYLLISDWIMGRLQP